MAHLAMKESIDKGEGPRIRWLGERAIWTQAATKDLCVASEDKDSLLFGTEDTRKQADLHHTLAWHSWAASVVLITLSSSSFNSQLRMIKQFLTSVNYCDD